MKNLMKYELRKTLAIKLMILGATALAEIVFLIGLWADKNRMMGIGVGLLAMLAFGGVMIIGVASVVILHRDMNTKQSYMLFMTPNNSYRILGAKVLENGISILLAGAFYFALAALDITLLFAHEGRLADLWNWLKDLLQSFDARITMDTSTLMALTFNLLVTWIGTVCAAYLGDVISTALLNGKRFNGLVSFLAFIALMWLVGFVQGKATAGISGIQTVFLVDGGIALALAVIMYVLTAQIMERKLSV